MTQENVATAYLHDQAKAHLNAFVQRIENIEEQKAALGADLKEIYAEAKSTGFCPKTIRKIVSLRKKDSHVRLEEEAILATYLSALGMIADLPLGAAAIKSSSPQRAEKAQEAAKTGAASQVSRDLDEARRKGQQAGRSDIAETGNPYLFEDPRYSAWENGRRETAMAKEPVAA